MIKNQSANVVEATATAVVKLKETLPNNVSIINAYNNNDLFIYSLHGNNYVEYGIGRVTQSAFVERLKAFEVISDSTPDYSPVGFMPVSDGDILYASDAAQATAYTVPLKKSENIHITSLNDATVTFIAGIAIPALSTTFSVSGITTIPLNASPSDTFQLRLTFTLPANADTNVKQLPLQVKTYVAENEANLLASERTKAVTIDNLVQSVESQTVEAVIECNHTIHAGDVFCFGLSLGNSANNVIGDVGVLSATIEYTSNRHGNVNWFNRLESWENTLVWG